MEPCRQGSSPSPALLLKRERGESPLLSRSCEPPLMSGVNNTSHWPVASRLASEAQSKSPAGKAFATGRRVRRPAETIICKHRRWTEPRGLGCNGNDTATPSAHIHSADSHNCALPQPIIHIKQKKHENFYNPKLTGSRALRRTVSHQCLSATILIHRRCVHAQRRKLRQ